MIDFLLESKARGSGTAPVEFVEFVLLPRQGWPKSELDRLSLADRHLLMHMLELEAEYGNRK